MEETNKKQPKSDSMADLTYGFLLLSGGLIIAASIFLGVSFLTGNSPLPRSLYGYNVILAFIFVVIPTFTLGWILIAIGKITSLLGIIANK